MSTSLEASIERFFQQGLKFTHLRILVKLAELGQITRVATAFHVTQPAISRRIAEIENALGRPVVQRVGNATALTDIGEVIVTHAREILRRVELTQRDVSAISAGTAGHVRLGSVATLPEPLISRAIQRFLQWAPSASLSFLEGPLDQLIRKLGDGELDIAIGRNHVFSMDVSLHQETLRQEAFVFVVGTGHPLGRDGLDMSWKDLRQQRWLTPLQGTPAFTTLSETLNTHHIGVDTVAVESSSLTLNLALIQSGGFVSILPLSVARHHAEQGTMRILPLPPLDPLGEVVSYWPIDAKSSGAQLFADCLRRTAAELFSGNSD